MQLATILSAQGNAVLTIRPEASVAGLVAMLAEHSIGALVVSPDGATIMTPQVSCAPPTASDDEVMHLMTERRIRHVPITDDTGVLIGIVSIGDVVKSRLGELKASGRPSSTTSPAAVDPQSQTARRTNGHEGIDARHP